MEENELPKIDLPEDWVIGTDINKDLLGLYTHYPVRLKCEIFVLCLEGEVEALVNLNEMHVHPNEVITLMPGSIFQINEIKGDLRIYFLGFSSKFIERGGQSHSMLDAIFLTLGRPAIPLKPEGAAMLEQYLQMLIAMYERFTEGVISAEAYLRAYDRISRDFFSIYENAFRCYIHWKGPFVESF